MAPDLQPAGRVEAVLCLLGGQQRRQRTHEELGWNRRGRSLRTGTGSAAGHLLGSDGITDSHRHSLWTLLLEMFEMCITDAFFARYRVALGIFFVFA